MPVCTVHYCSDHSTEQQKAIRKGLMKMRTIFAAICIFCMFFLSYADNTRKTDALYNRIIMGGNPDIAQLTLFFSAMPKGADLHHHYSGSIFAETYLEWADSAKMTLDTTTLRLRNDTCGITIQQLYAKPLLYRKLLMVWSDKDFSNHSHEQLPPDLNFFNTFSYFDPVSCNYVQGLNIIKKQSKNDNISYVETMLSTVPRNERSDTLFDKTLRSASTPDLRREILNSKFNTFNDRDTLGNGYVVMLDSIHKNIDDSSFTMRYQTYATRNNPPSDVFSSLYAAFAAADKSAKKSKLIVGVNFVGPENGVVAIKDYTIHMEMIAFLKKKFPAVTVALHAGELTMGMIPVNELRFHIAQAVYCAGAQRIGHGVDVPYEKNAVDLLKYLRKNAAVEINLTSNEFILGVKGEAHPYRIYSAYNVPLVICTDDAGVSRDNLSNEYVLLASRYKPSYSTIKTYVYNSIRYSFLPDSDKARLTKQLDAQFVQFESKMAEYADVVLQWKR